MRHACVALLCFMDPSEAPCSVPACRLWAILRSSPEVVVFEPITRVKAWYVLSEGVVCGLWIGRGVVWPSAKIHVEDVSDCREMRTAVWGGVQTLPSSGL